MKKSAGNFKVYDILSLTIRPEKCDCGEWKNIHKTWKALENGQVHETLERICEKCEDEVIMDIFGGNEK